jgi:hypothetical protein
LPVVNVEADNPTVHHPPPTGVGIQDVPTAPLLAISSVGLNHDFDLLLAGLSNRRGPPGADQRMMLRLRRWNVRKAKNEGQNKDTQVIILCCRNLYGNFKFPTASRQSCKALLKRRFDAAGSVPALGGKSFRQREGSHNLSQS